MWERFTAEAKSVVDAAREEAVRLNSVQVGTEHMLLALCREPDGEARRLFEKFGVDSDSLTLDLEWRCQDGPPTATLGDKPFTTPAKKVLEFAVEEARRFNRSYIGTEHILVGLIREGEGIAAESLKVLNIDLECARKELMSVRLT